MVSLGKVTMQTRFWAQGMLDAQPMESIRELRWDASVRGEPADRNASVLRLPDNLVLSRGIAYRSAGHDEPSALTGYTAFEDTAGIRGRRTV